jgi:hypothetical protein
MKEFFGDLGQGAGQLVQNVGQAFSNNPTVGLAGLLMAQGMDPEKAYVQAAQIHQGQEKNDIQQQKIQQQQQQSMIAAQILQQGGGLPEMLAAGITHPAILGSLPQPQWVPSGDMPGGGSFRTPGMPGMGGGMPQQSGGMPSPQGNQMSTGGGGPQQPPMTASQTAPSPQKTPNEMEQERKKELADQKSALKIKERRTADTDKWQQNNTHAAEGAGNIIRSANILEKTIPEMFSGTWADKQSGLAKGTHTYKKAVRANETFKKIVNQVIRDIETTTRYRTTDAARDLIVGTKPEETNTPEGNLSIVKAIKTFAKLQSERAEASNEWLEKGGNEHEFETRWNKFQTEYPSIDFDPNSAMLVSNEGNLKKWRNVLFGNNEASEEEKEPPILRKAREMGLL